MEAYTYILVLFLISFHRITSVLLKRIGRENMSNLRRGAHQFNLTQIVVPQYISPCDPEIEKCVLIFRNDCLPLYESYIKLEKL